MSENQREILRTMTQEAESMGLYDQPEIAADSDQCNQPEGHMGWLNCPTHNREIMASVALIGRQKWGTSADLRASQPDSTDEEIIDVLLPAQELRTALRRAEMERDECSEGVLDMGAELVSLRADLNRANEHNRALSRVVDAAKEWCLAAVESEDDGEDERSVDAGEALYKAVAALPAFDKAQTKEQEHGS